MKKRSRKTPKRTTKKRTSSNRRSKNTKKYSKLMIIAAVIILIGTIFQMQGIRPIPLGRLLTPNIIMVAACLINLVFPIGPIRFLVIFIAAYIAFPF